MKKINQHILKALKGVVKIGPSGHVLCFLLENYGEVSRNDPDALFKMQAGVSEEGGVPYDEKLQDDGSFIYCVDQTDPEVSVETLIERIASYGFHVRLIEKGDKGGRDS